MMRLVIFLVFWANLFANADLEDAYKKEYAFLVAQKKALQERVEIVKKEAKEKISSAEKDIAKLQEKYIANSSDSEKKAQQLLEIEREAQTVQDDSATLEATLMQADLTLKKHGFATQEKESVKKLQEIFIYSPKLLGELSSVRKTKGSFYVQDGSKIDGEIIKVGNVAAYGIGEKIKGILIPAGEGEYKLFNQNALEFEDKLTNTGKGSIDIFLFESLDKEIEEKKEKTVLGIIQSGGSVAWVIVWLGVFALFLTLLRIIFLKRASMDTNRVSEDVAGLVEKGFLKEANEKCATYKNATSRVLSATIRNLDREREHLEDIVNESILHENSYLDKFGSTIIIVAAVSPLLGLLGTVTGMISTFDIITEFGTGDPKMLSGGISEALITTELGLVVAIPALIFGNLLSGWAENIKDDMEKAALKVINIHKQNTIKA
ncbi:MAG: biopolymer transport protein ExbB [Campylobacterota bacterium]|nr:biopolymer transport protein ExbB [Campylobacterota bacterium]